MEFNGTEARVMVGTIRADLAVMTDELLDYEAERFRFYEVYGLLGISFATFLLRPDHYVRAALGKVRAVLGISTIGVSPSSTGPRLRDTAGAGYPISVRESVHA